MQLVTEEQQQGDRMGSTSNRFARALQSQAKGLAFCVTVLFGSDMALAQEGHPYEGTWRGTATAGAEALPVVIIIDYDGEKLNGMVNPGRNSFPFTTVEHDAPNWTLTVAATNRQNEAINFSAVMHEIGSAHRYMEGTWQQARKEYSFRITRE